LLKAGLVFFCGGRAAGLVDSIGLLLVTLLHPMSLFVERLSALVCTEERRPDIVDIRTFSR